MKKYLNVLNICLSILLISNSIAQAQSDPKKPYIILVSLDGFRWDYPSKYRTPNLDKIAKEGVKAKSLIPCYPTKTFPNHYSIATGLYPDHHGLVQNDFYDSTIQQTYKMSDRKTVENPAFYYGEPIWVTARKQNIITASFFWVGSEAPIQGTYPNYWKKYEHKFPFSQRIDTVIAWLNLPEAKRPHLLTLYFDEPDGVSHKFGPDDKNTQMVVEKMDSLIGILYQRIKKLQIANQVNLIVLSDHGMATTSKESAVKLCNYIPKNWYIKYLGDNPVTMVQPAKGYEDSIILALKNVEHLKAWKKKDIPSRFHFGTSNRIFDIVIAADSAWSITWHEVEKHKNLGNHGYDNRNTDMHAIFYATGPAFKKNFVAPSFNNIDVYPLITKILGIKPAKIDGDFTHVENLLKSK